MTTKEITYDDLGIRIEDVYEVMECDGTPEEAVCREVEEMLADIRQWLKPRYAFTVVRGDMCLENQTLTVNGTTLNCGKIITRQLRGSEAYALFVGTAGIDFQNLMERLTEEGDMVRLFIAHSVGTVIAERCADQMERVLQGTIDKLGWKRTNRFSPGYCGWHVREQQLLFPLMQGHNTGVTLTPSSLMIPIKSVSGVIGLGPDVRRLEYTCGLCNFEKCYKNKKKRG